MRIYIDTDELQTLSELVRLELEALSNVSAIVMRAWSSADDGAPDLAGLRAQADALRARIDGLGGRVHEVAGTLRNEAAVGLVAGGTASQFVGGLQPVVPSGWPPLLQGILGTPVGAPNATFAGLAAGMAGGGFGTTSNPALNSILGQAAGAPSLLAPFGIVPPAVGGDINMQALNISAQLGVQHAFNGTGPLFADGALAGMHNSLGIAFPAASGSTIGEANALVAAHNARVLEGSGMPSGFRANPDYYAPRGAYNNILIHPNVLPYPSLPSNTVF